MSDPKYAQETDNGRYYDDPHDGRLVPSVTNVLSEWAKPALAPAAAKVTAEYIVDHLPAAVRAARKQGTRDAFLKQAKAEHRNVWESRRDLGTLVHRHAEAHVLGQPMPEDERVTPFIDQYIRWLSEFGVDIEADVESAEITVFGRGGPLRYGGTADLWANLRRLPRTQSAGLWLIDIKTSLTKPPGTVYRDHVLQLAALRHADVAILPDDTEIEVPEFAGAAILNLRTNSYGFVPLPADEAAFLAFKSMLAVALYAHALDMKPFKPVKALRAVKGVA